MGTPDRCADWLRAVTSVEVRRSILVRFVSDAQRAGAAELSDPCRHSSNAASNIVPFRCSEPKLMRIILTDTYKGSSMS